MHPASAWDPSLNEVILFGGSSTRYLNGTWAFSGGLKGDWKKLDFTVNPAARRSEGMAWDPSLNAIVMFTGHDGYPGTDDSNFLNFVMFNDTWELETVHAQPLWVNVTSSVGTAPPPESEPQLAWDPSINAIVEFGGYNYGSSVQHSTGYHAYNSTWALVAGRWLNLSLSVSPYVRDRDRDGLGPDPARGVAVRWPG